MESLLVLPKPITDGNEKVGLRKCKRSLGEELSILAKDLRRIGMVRSYVETTLSLEVLVGDLEDAVLCVTNQKALNGTDYRWKNEKMILACRAMNDIEDVLTSVLKNTSKWCMLLKSVDGRVDKPLAVLRLQALADHRIILNSIGWPPPLLTSELEGENGSELPNPLVLMQGGTKERYSQSFLALCSLQHLHNREKRKNFDVLGHKRDHRYGLWTIDELVSPIALRTEHHFSKWHDQPKFIFALGYKVTRDLVVGIDDILQPLIDKARMHKLADLGTAHVAGESIGFSREISLLSIFCDQPDWLRIWAKIELKDALKKLSSELENPKAWMISNKVKSYTELEPESFILTSGEDHNAPPIAEAVVKITQVMIERCQTLPSFLLRIQFIRSSSVKIPVAFL
ncbi:hypothetical protein IFM89_013851 [Coptis chinensis]|uniref:Uncharacterized protein n=1 Tax=Coptis chinensis TaxID=261450 RepID=A0A835ITD9_9MAGN|nr:hypothetical protein IFM89_013851 [Coptis chinensis]